MTGLLERFGDEYVWDLKYRPKTIEDMILPKRIKGLFDTEEKRDDVGNLLFTGPRGAGKTTVACCVADQSGRDVFYINMSLNNSIELIRNQVLNFVTSVSFDDKKKIIVGDEFEELSPKAMNSLKSLIEEFSKNVNFIFMTNHEVKITKELKSRLTEVSFKFNKTETKKLSKDYWERICNLLKNDDIKFSSSGIAKLVKNHFPDMRKIILRCQEIVKVYGKITPETIETNNSKIICDINELFCYIKDKDFIKIRQFVMDESIDLEIGYSELDESVLKFTDDTIPIAILIIADWQYKSAFSADKQIPMTACLVQLAQECELKR